MPVSWNLMILDRRWREHQLGQRLIIWEPRIGRKATETYMRGRWHIQFGLILILLSVALNIILQAAKAGGVALAVAALVCWPLILFCLVQGARLQIRASRQAGEVAGTSDKARPPVKNLEVFERWEARSKYSRRPN